MEYIWWFTIAYIYIYTGWHPKHSAGEHYNNKLDLKNAYTSKSTKYKLDLKNAYTSKSTKYKLDLKNAYTSKSTKQRKEQYNNYKQEAEDYFYVMETATNLGGGGGGGICRQSEYDTCVRITRPT